MAGLRPAVFGSTAGIANAYWFKTRRRVPWKADMLESFGPPDRFDEFRVMRPLGEGTMGAVYLCTDTVLYRRVAVKFLKGVEMDERMRDRFLNEARAIAQLSHPNVVTIYRVGEVHTVPYLASEYIEGQSLERLALPIDFPLLLQVAMGAAQGLAAAHRHGILHRDIKPATFTSVEG
jgi:serine/threonine protein kinase